MRTRRVTEYIYRHYPSLLTDVERSHARLRDDRFKAAASEARRRKEEAGLQVDSWENLYPDLHEQLEEGTIGLDMDRAAARVLQERPHEVFLNTCPKCGSLCLTPRARACLDCGHTWHAQEEPS
jgi:hypothetical protein